MKRIFLLTNILMGCFVNYQIESAGSWIHSPSKREVVMHWFKAIEKGDIKTVEELIGLVDINVRDFHSRTALVLAAELGNANIVNLLLQKSDILINAQDDGGATALIAAAQKHPDVVRLLLQVPKININARDDKGRTALMHAALFQRDKIVTQLLARPDININIQSNNGSTALMYSIADGMTQIAKLHLARPDIDVNSIDDAGFTTLMWASINGYEKTVALLLQVPGINITHVGLNGKTALVLAGEYKYKNIEILIKNKIDELLAAGIASIKGNNLELLKKVVSQIGLTQIDAEGNTLLHHALFCKNDTIAAYILGQAPIAEELLNISNNKKEKPGQLIPESSDLVKQAKKVVSSPKRQLSDDEQLFESPKHEKAKICSRVECAKEGCSMLCSRCKKAYYCSTECQKTDWKLHKRNCNAIW